MSLHNFLFIIISRSLPNLKQKYTTHFRHKLIHNSITQSKASRSIMGHYDHNCRQCSTTTGDCYTTHSMHIHDHILYTARRCNNFEFTIHLMTVGMLKRSISYSAVHEISNGDRFFTFNLPGGAARTLAPRQLRHWVPNMNAFIVIF